MYDANWYNSGDIVPNQVTSASDALSIVDGSANAGISTEYSRGDHEHRLNITTTITISDSASGSVGTANYYARSDHFHLINITTSVPPQDSASGSVGTTNYYAINDHSHPINVETNASNIPVVNGVGANGTSAFYVRQDHVHPQQLTYDGNVTATKFIKAGGLAPEVLCANGDTTTIDSKLSRTYNSSGVNGINTVYGVFTAPTRISANYVVDSGVNQLFHTHTGTGAAAIYSAYVRIDSTNSITMVVSDQGTYYTNRITEILTQDVVQGVANGTQIQITYDFANGGIINNMLQVNPTGRTYAVNTTQTGQWEKSKTNDNALTINPSSLRQSDHSIGLSINSDSSVIKFNGNELVNVGTDQTITGRKAFNNIFQIEPTSDSYNEGIRISRSTVSNFSGIYLGCNPNSTDGPLADQWSIVNTPIGELMIGVNVQLGQDNQGLMISADGNALTFNGRVL
ncbi:MAG: hypothetical protein EZS28_015447 [Streblomastix strix]|uniref:Uncharacterized protein n=1 Tax=Streblomastix strix TaxID=222440 RepID=A0A5J4W3E5_9EUKA|nr:MAG: hypothetical protein EZS28_015447 [Streblomastix strix]